MAGKTTQCEFNPPEVDGSDVAWGELLNAKASYFGGILL